MLAEPDISKLTGVRRTGAGSEWAYRRLLQHDPCAYCGDPAHERWGCQVDHIHAKADGGPNHWTNYTAACSSCNQLKINMPMWVFLLEREYIEWETFRRRRRNG